MPTDDFVSLFRERQGECGFRFLCSLLLKAVRIMGNMENVGRIVSPNSKNVNKDKIVAYSFSLLNFNSKSVVLCDYLFI